MRMTQAPVLTVSGGETAGDFGADDSSTMALMSNWVLAWAFVKTNQKSLQRGHSIRIPFQKLKYSKNNLYFFVSITLSEYKNLRRSASPRNAAQNFFVLY
ncbi:hypothetical protein [Duganella hordei]|uniref:hypothetical protein n=1 Tax=Duganella hordei TaxID=2865934 RepID=UPI00333EA00D